MTVFVSAGGGIISTEEGLNTSWIREFAKEIKSFAKKGVSFYIVVGGGKIAEQYVKATNELKLKSDFADDIAIDVTKINAKLVKEYLKDIKNVVIDHGQKIGQTTDKVLIDIAAKKEAKEVVNLTVVEGVYDKDPKKFTDAKLISHINASDYLKMFKEQQVHRPRVNTPFEYNAVKKALEEQIYIYVMSGLDPHKQFHDFLQGKRDVGTRIIPK